MEFFSEFKGATPKRLEKLQNMGISTISDLVSYFPKSYSDYSRVNTLDEALENPDKRLLVCVKAISATRIPTRGRVPIYKIQVKDSVATASLYSFGYQNKQITPDPSVQYLISGIFKYRVKSIECSQFTLEEVIRDSSDLQEKIRGKIQIVPFYTVSSGMTQKLLRSFIRQALFTIKTRLNENLPSFILKKYGYLSRWEALYQVHFPDSMEILEVAHRRLKYSELFRLQFHFALKQHYFKNQKPRVYAKQFPKTHHFLSSLPFTLTPDQNTVLAEIEDDLLSRQAMHRLLMGDVGSGKTLVAFASLLKVLENGYQGVFLAPTEILAKQHFQTFTRYVSPFEWKIDLLTGSTKPKERRDILISLYKGQTQLLVGTHSVLSEDIRFASLGMVVIDEQHKFGVGQRMEIVKKGETPDVLVMSATPIPRTLGYVHFGDMDISTISGKPQGRLPITTTWVEESQLSDAYEKMREEVQKGQQGYIVYPLVMESEKSNRKSVIEGFQFLTKHIFPDLRLTLLHGQMSDDEKTQAIKEFRKGESQILVSTIVIEVGVDVPNATCLIIENAPSFGLSTLHQLRGRVGRNSLPSYCFLVSQPKASMNADAIARMQAMVDHHDGFVLAQKDMELRGIGNLIGKNQSGSSGLKISNIIADQKILEQARKDAFQILQDDLRCEKPEHRCLKRLFQRSEQEILDIIRN